MPAGRIAARRDLALASAVPLAHDADEAVAEQAPARAPPGPSSCRRRRFPDRRCRRAAACCPCRASARSAAARRAPPGRRARCRAGPKFSTKPSLVRSVKVRTSCLRSSVSAGRSTASRVLHELADPLAQLERARRRHQAAPGPDQQRIAGRLAQSRQRPAHRRRAQPQPLRRARHAALGEQHVEGDQQVEIGCRHAPTIAQLDRDMASNARIKCKCMRLPPCQATDYVFRRVQFAESSESEVHVEANHRRTDAGSRRTLREPPSARWALASLSLSMLLSSLGTSIANVGLADAGAGVRRLVPAGPVGRARLSARHHHADRQRRTARRHRRPPAAAAGRHRRCSPRPRSCAASRPRSGC